MRDQKGVYSRKIVGRRVKKIQYTGDKLTKRIDYLKMDFEDRKKR